MSPPNLFTPVEIGAIRLSNRIVMAPMTRNRTPGHVPNALNATYYRQRASAGLIITEGTAPSPLGQGYIDIPGLYTAQQVDGWRRVTDAVHAQGGKIFVQLMFVGRVSHPDFLGGHLPVGPSAVRPVGEVHTYGGRKDFVAPRALTGKQIEDVILDFARAARNGVRAGFDGVEVHGANGYLLDQFLAVNANRRSDRWGGSIEGRSRLLLEVTDAVAREIGSLRVGVRLSPGSTFNDIDHGEIVPLFDYVGSELSKRNLAYLHVIGGADAGVLDQIRCRFGGPLIANRGYTAVTANAAIEAGKADLVSFGAPFISNPDLAQRLRTGAPLAQGDPSTFYGGGANGYIDYPPLQYEAVGNGPSFAWGRYGR